MAITNILRDFAGSVSIVRIMSSDNLSTIGTSGYLVLQQDNIEQINSGLFSWVPSDFILVFASDGWGLFTISPDFSTLDAFFEPGSGTVTSIGTGTGLIGGPITTSGIISLAPIATLNILSNITGTTAAPIPNTLTTIIDAAIGSTQGDILYRSATAWTVLPPGTSGNVLTSGGASSNPSWASGSSIVPAAFTESNDTNVTLTLSGTPSTALLEAVEITAGWIGELSLARGGTNASLTASNGGIFYSSASAGEILAGTATASQVLLSGASTTPAWSTTTYPGSTTVSQLLYSSSANVIAGLATLNNGVLTTGNTGVPALLANSGTAGFVLTANSGAPPSWQVAPTTGPWSSGTGTNSAIGGDGTALASGTEAIAYGTGGTSASGANSIAIGQNAKTGSSGSNAFAQGFNSTANGGFSVSLGRGNTATGTESLCLGAFSTATGNNSVAIGNSATANNNGSLAICDGSGSGYTLDATTNQFASAFSGGYLFKVGSTLTLTVDTSFNFRVNHIGSGLAVAEGTNGKQGIATLSGGTVTVSTNSVTANSRIFLTIQSPGGTLGSVYVSARTAGTSFTISSTSAIDTSVVGYLVMEPA